MKKFTHIDDKGHARMVDVSAKKPTGRVAVARGSVSMAKKTLDLIERHDIIKGNVLEVAQLAGIMAAKKTSSLIPLCHPLNLTNVTVALSMNREESKVEIEAQTACTGQTGVEMESLTAVAVAALTVYDMCKAADKRMVISDIMLLEKKGGKSGDWKR